MLRRLQLVAMNCSKPIFGGPFSLPISNQSLYTGGRGCKGDTDHPNFWNNSNKRIFHKYTIRVCWDLCSSGSFIKSELTAPEGRHISSKIFSKVRVAVEGDDGRYGRKRYFLDEGSLIIPQINDFFTCLVPLIFDSLCPPCAIRKN